MPPFTKSSPELVARFDEVAARHPAAQRRKMFGYPAMFVGGNFATGLFEESWVVRLADPDLTTLLATPGALSGGHYNEPTQLRRRDRKSTRLNSSHEVPSRMPSSA